ncbi:hypothetical protein GQR58_030231 [Nymphon striatum]|nr:hypothetical protein GQR58_030231 [Nymphon striatum]
MWRRRSWRPRRSLHRRQSKQRPPVRSTNQADSFFDISDESTSDTISGLIACQNLSIACRHVGLLSPCPRSPPQHIGRRANQAMDPSPEDHADVRQAGHEGDEPGGCADDAQHLVAAAEPVGDGGDARPQRFGCRRFGFVEVGDRSEADVLGHAGGEHQARPDVSEHGADVGEFGADVDEAFTEAACQRDDRYAEHEEHNEVPDEQRRLVADEEFDGFSRRGVTIGVVTQARDEQSDAKDEGRSRDEAADSAGSGRSEILARWVVVGGGSHDYLSGLVDSDGDEPGDRAETEDRSDLLKGRHDGENSGDTHDHAEVVDPAGEEPLTERNDAYPNRPNAPEDFVAPAEAVGHRVETGPHRGGHLGVGAVQVVDCGIGDVGDHPGGDDHPRPDEPEHRGHSGQRRMSLSETVPDREHQRNESDAEHDHDRDVPQVQGQLVVGDELRRCGRLRRYEAGEERGEHGQTDHERTGGDKGADPTHFLD